MDNAAHQKRDDNRFEMNCTPNKAIIGRKQDSWEEPGRLGEWQSQLMMAMNEDYLKDARLAAAHTAGKKHFPVGKIQRTCIYGTPYSHPERRGYYMEYRKRTFLGFSQKENAALPAVSDEVRFHTIQ